MPCQYQRKIRSVRVPLDWRERARKARDRVANPIPSVISYEEMISGIQIIRPEKKRDLLAHLFCRIDAAGPWILLGTWLTIALVVALRKL